MSPAFSVLVRQPVPNDGGWRRGRGTEGSCSPYSQAATQAHPHPYTHSEDWMQWQQATVPTSQPLHQETAPACLPTSQREVRGKQGHWRPWSKIPIEFVHMSETIWSSRCCDLLGEITLCFISLCSLCRWLSTELGPVASLQSWTAYWKEGRAQGLALIVVRPQETGGVLPRLSRVWFFFPF